MNEPTQISVLPPGSGITAINAAVRANLEARLSPIGKADLAVMDLINMELNGHADDPRAAAKVCSEMDKQAKREASSPEGKAALAARVRTQVLDFLGLPETTTPRALAQALKDKLAAEGLFDQSSDWPTLQEALDAVHVQLSVSSPPVLTTLRIANGALTAKDLPNRLKLLAWGQNDTTKGIMILDNLSLSEFAPMQKRMGRERVALDYEHNTVPESEEFLISHEPREVAAFGAPIIRPGDGLWLEDLVWTPSGQAKARNYEDLSPAPYRTSDGHVVGLHSVALTRAGAVDGLTFFSAPSRPGASSSPGSENLPAVIAAFRAATGDSFERAYEQVRLFRPELFSSPVRPLQTRGTPDRTREIHAAIATHRKAAGCDFDASYNYLRATNPSLFS